jgi:hypothetical protein
MPRRRGHYVDTGRQLGVTKIPADTTLRRASDVVAVLYVGRPRTDATDRGTQVHLTDTDRRADGAVARLTGLEVAQRRHPQEDVEENID